MREGLDRRGSWALRGALGIACLLPFAELGAQRREFVVQTMLIPPLESQPARLGSSIADELRGLIGDAVSRKELRLISRNELRAQLQRASFPLDSPLDIVDVRALGRKLRVDEVILGRAERTDAGVRIHAQLVLLRNDKLRQPLPVASGGTVAEAARMLATEIVAARRQLVPHRRCENHLRERNAEQGAAAARDGITAYPQATLSRLCLIEAFVQAGAPADSVLAHALVVLDADSTNAIALERAAGAYDAMGRRQEAGSMWVRVFETDTASAPLAERVVSALSRYGDAGRARPLIVRAVASHPDNVELLRLRWLVMLALDDWKESITSGLALLAADGAVATDTLFYVRMATAYRADSQPERALEYASRGVVLFPGNARLYVLYTQLVRAEAAVAPEKGIARFPRDGATNALYAQILREEGKLQESLDATRRALAADAALPRGFIQLAQTYLDLGKPDSAATALAEALRQGESRALVAQFALARGNTLYKAAAASKARLDFATAARFLQLADSLAPSPESKFLLGAAAFSVGQSAATEAPKSASCDLSRQADSWLSTAEAKLPGGGSVAPEAAKQYLDYVAQLRPYVENQLKQFCGDSAAPTDHAPPSASIHSRPR